MAIIYVCKRCDGNGTVVRKLWFMKKKVSCPYCKGVGRRKYEKNKIGC